MPGEMYQFVPLSKARVLTRVIPSVLGAGGHVVLDLEDSVQNVVEPDQTAALKMEARRSLLRIVREAPELFAGSKVGIRINARGTEDHLLDVEALAACGAVTRWESVWLPKATSSSEIQSLSDQLRGTRVTALIETASGVRALPEVLAGSRDGLSHVAFGYFDYYLDAGVWPFPAIDSPLLWALVQNLISLTEGAGYGYIHCPIPNLDDDAGFLRVQAMLAATCRRPYGQLTLSMRQTRLGRMNVRPRRLSCKGMGTGGVDDGAREARRVVGFFAASRCRGRSFSLDPATGDFVAPHQFLAARRFLARLGRAP